MTHGPIPKPAKLRMLDGNPGKRPAPTMKAARTAGVPSPPKELDPVARAEWFRVTRLLHAEGIVSLLDRAVLTAYCAAWSRLLAATAALADGSPLTARGSHGGEQPRPEARIAREASQLVARLAGELGLSPAARARLGKTEDNDRKTASWLPSELRGDKGKA